MGNVLANSVIVLGGMVLLIGFWGRLTWFFKPSFKQFLLTVLVVLFVHVTYSRLIGAGPSFQKFLNVVTPAGFLAGLLLSMAVEALFFKKQFGPAE